MSYHIATANGMYLGKRTDDPDPELDSEFPLRGVYFVADVQRAEIYLTLNDVKYRLYQLKKCFSDGFLSIRTAEPLVDLWDREFNAIRKNEAYMAAINGLSAEQFITMVYDTNDDD